MVIFLLSCVLALVFGATAQNIAPFYSVTCANYVPNGMTFCVGAENGKAFCYGSSGGCVWYGNQNCDFTAAQFGGHKFTQNHDCVEQMKIPVEQAMGSWPWCACSKLTAAPTTLPTIAPTGPSPLPSGKPTAAPTVDATAVQTIPSFKVQNGFSFAARTSTGAVRVWGGDSIVAVTTLVASAAGTVVGNKASFVAVQSTSTMAAWGVDAYRRNFNMYNNVNKLVANEGAYATTDHNGAARAFGGDGNGNNIATSGFSSQLASGVLDIIPSSGSFTALKSDGTVYTWGNKFCGGGISSITRTDLQGIVKVFATRTAFAGVNSAGKVMTWGDQYGGGDSSVVADQLQSGVIHIVASQNVFVAFKADGSLVVWGNPTAGGDASAVSHELHGIVNLAFTSSAFAAIRGGGTVVTWGKGSAGGDSSAVADSLIGIVKIYSTWSAFAAVTATGAVVAWGSPENGGTIPSALQSKLSSGITAIFSTRRAFAALKGATGELVLWGNPYHGADAGDMAPNLASGVRTVCANEAAFTAFLQDGRTVAWGHPSSIPYPTLLTGDFTGVNACA